MYSSRGSNAYGQASYASQSAYGQTLGPGYSGSSVGVPQGSSQVSLSSRHSMLGASQEAELGGYRGHTAAAPHYGGQYSSVYGSAALSGTQQVPAIHFKGTGTSTLEGRVTYASAIPDSPKFASSDYGSSSSHRYGVKGDQIFAEKIPDYSAFDRRQYGEQQSAYMGRDLQSESTGRFAETVSLGHQHQASLLRQEQSLKSKSLQSSTLDGGSRQADYLAARGTASHNSTQDLMPYGGRMDADPRNLSLLNSSSYSRQHASSISGAAPSRNVDDLTYLPSSANPGYGVSLPPGRDYAAGKGLRSKSIDSDYPSSLFSHGVHPRIAERKDDRASYFQDFELREEERCREHLRERGRQREREKERERRRLREHERGRERALERLKERERLHKRGIKIKHERPPPRVSRDRRGPSLTKERRSLRQDSPHHEVLHRRHSPVKEKRREYVCKVSSSGLVDVERDYISLDKRYPKLFVPPEVSKVVVNWPKEDLKLSIHTPVSFEHDFIEEESAVDPKEQSTKPLTEEPALSEHGSTVWNAKIILMSGLSRNAFEELSSEKSSDDCIPHICNILRFAVVKKDHSFMAMGGPWHLADGVHPSVDDSSLVQTAIRYSKDVAQLDLRNCHNWNQFVEIHYDRVGKDGLCSHKEVTVLFVPDLSECLPSLDEWRAQWLAHRKNIAEKERQLSLKRERSGEKKNRLKDKEMDSLKDVERLDKSEQKESSSSGQAVDVNKSENVGSNMKGNAANQKGNGSNKKVEETDGNETGLGVKDIDKKEQGETAGAQTAGSAKPGKRKIIRRIVKQKVTDKSVGLENSNSIQDDKLDENNAKSEISAQQEESVVEPAEVKTFARKKVVKKAPSGKTTQDKDRSMQLEVKAEEGTIFSDDKPKDNSDPGSTAALQDAPVKTTAKKKIIKRVLKRKVTGKAGDVVADIKIDNDGDQTKVPQTQNQTENTGRLAVDAENDLNKVKKTENQAGVPNSSITKIKDVKEDKKDGKGANVETESRKENDSAKDNYNGKREKSKGVEKLKDEKAQKNKDGKADSRSNSTEVKEKRKPEEPPLQPGLILQTKWNKDSKLCSLSVSLDTLLDYTDKDMEESSFELLLFAETLYEMLQYQMGCRLLEFLQRLHFKFLAERNQRKRQRHELQLKENEKTSSVKRPKTNKLNMKSKNTESETANMVQPDDEKTVVKDEVSVDHFGEAKLKVESEDEEDPEECEELEDASSQQNSSDENDEENDKTDANAGPGKEAESLKDEADVSTKEQTSMEDTETKHTADVDMDEKGEKKVETGKKENVDKELLQAFRFFDRNLVGYIRVEDLRLIIHNLGKFLSHRYVKELVQSALLESNTGRDDHIIYNKLVRLSHI